MIHFKPFSDQNDNDIIVFILKSDEFCQVPPLFLKKKLASNFVWRNHIWKWIILKGKNTEIF